MTQPTEPNSVRVPTHLSELPADWLASAFKTAVGNTLSAIYPNLGGRDQADIARIFAILDIRLFDVPGPGRLSRVCEQLRCPVHERLDHSRDVMQPLQRAREAGPQVLTNLLLDADSANRAWLLSHTCVCFKEPNLTTYQAGRLRECDYRGVGGVYEQVPLPAITGTGQFPRREGRLSLPFIVTAHFCVTDESGDEDLGLLRHHIAMGVAEQLVYGLLMNPQIVPECTDPGGSVTEYRSHQ